MARTRLVALWMLAWCALPALAFRSSFVANALGRHFLRCRDEECHVGHRMSKLSTTHSHSDFGFQEDEQELRAWVEQVQQTKGILQTGLASNGKEDDGSGSSAHHLANRLESINALRGKSSSTALRYFHAIASATPEYLLEQFFREAPSNVQQALTTAISDLLGSINAFSLEVVVLTTPSKLSALALQMHLIGYMLKNAELSMSSSPQLHVPPKATVPGLSSDQSDPSKDLDTSTPGDGHTAPASSSLSSALNNDAASLREELRRLQEVREEELRRNLMTYVRTLPVAEALRLTSNISTDTLQAFQLLVAAELEKHGLESAGGNAVTAQQYSSVAAMCMAHIVAGYKLRELEVLDAQASQT